MKANSIKFPVVNILSNPARDWRLIRRSGSNKRFAFRELEVDWKKYNTKEYLFTHDSIVCSVQVEEDGHTIVPACEELINANGNAWKNEVLINCFKSFVGGENYVEHIQIPELSKGKILDAVIRPVKHISQLGQADIYVVDILVATNRKHTSLVNRIESGDINTLSMGCLANYCQCSICGLVFGDNDNECNHIKYHLGKRHQCKDGKTRVVAELCGACDKNGNYIEDSCQFIEASWVEHPAFEGAVVNYFIETEEERVARTSSKMELEQLFTSSVFNKLRVADKNSRVPLAIVRGYLHSEKINGIAKNLTGKK